MDNFADNKQLSMAKIWRTLIIDGLAIGVIMGLLEMCWTYLLPVIFPDRSYSLPAESLVRFFAIAVVTDTVFVIIGCICLGLLISLLYQIHKSACFFIFRPAFIKFLLLAGVLSYLYRGNLFRYVLLPTDPRRIAFSVIGILVIITTSAVLILIFTRLQKLNPRTPLWIWASVVVIICCILFPYYWLYTSKDRIVLDLPVLKKNQYNILLITIDTLRADYLGCYGNKAVKTPTLDKLAKDGHLFEKAFCQSPYTTPSHCSIMTSTYMNQHKAINGAAMKDGLPTVAEILNSNGYKTAAFVSCGMVRSGNSRLDKGFDYYEDSLSSYSSFFRHDECQYLLTVNIISKLQDHQIPGNIVSDRSIKWLSRKKNKPFFCWLHYFDPHDPYDAPEPYKNMYEEMIDRDLPYQFERMRYAGEVTYADSQIGRVIESLKKNKLYDNTLIIITSDHGEAFGEKHGDIIEYNHGDHLYDTTQHVPLIIKLPTERDINHRISHIVQLIDIAPSILEFLGNNKYAPFKGVSLMDLIKGQKRNKSGISFSESASPLNTTQEKILNERRLSSVRTEKIKYIRNITGQRQELYDLVLDPEEIKNIISENRQLAKESYQEIIENLGQETDSEKPATIDPSVIDQLKSLGYTD